MIDARRSLVLLLVTALAAPARARCPDHDPLKNAYFGDLHTHTSYSLDAYRFGTRTDPAAAYAFATGAAVDIGTGFDDSAREVAGPLGVTINASGGRLDSNAVTDHSEWLAVTYGCTQDPRSPFYGSAYYAGMRANDDAPPGVIPCAGTIDAGATGCLGEQTAAWAAEQQATEAANDPCTFTSLHGYEWTFGPSADDNDRRTLHHIVLFRNARVPAAPVDAATFPGVTAMMAALAARCNGSIGCEALTIPHNMNQSDGTAFLIPGYAASDLNRLLRYRRLVELHQHKGNSECMHDTADTGVVSACDFEVRPQFALPQDEPGYARPGMELGLERFAARAYTPHKVGFVGATDNHDGTPGHVGETSYPGHIGARDNTVRRRLGGGRATNNPGGLTGIWAEENTREALWAALVRRETFATSGPKIRVRFYQYGGMDDPCSDPAFPRAVVRAGGVPMGGTIHDGRVPPRFVVYALADETALAAVDLVKGYVRAGAAAEKVHTIALAAPPHCVTWTDPDFDASEPAFYYARVKEQPTWRWTHYDCAALRQASPANWQAVAPGCASSDPSTGGLDYMIQERAWTSSIWWLPGGPVTVSTAALRLLDGSAHGNPSRRRFVFKARTRSDTADHRVVPPVAGSAGDPTANGAALTVYNGETGEEAVVPLAASRWRRGPRSQYVFSDRAGPVQKVTVRADALGVQAGRRGWPFTLDEPRRQGAIAVRLQLGTADPWCAEAPAATSGKPPTTAKQDRIDRFVGARQAPPPDQCPLLGSPSGAFVDCL